MYQSYNTKKDGSRKVRETKRTKQKIRMTIRVMGHGLLNITLYLVNDRWITIEQ